MMQRALALIYPDQCILCASLVDRRGALCADCWSETIFLRGHTCDHCGARLTGAGDGMADLCDDCIAMPRPWGMGRAAISYEGAGRRLVLALKHGDRTELALPAAGWMAAAGRDILSEQPVLVPIPIHWTRRIARRYNQAAELSRALAGLTGLSHEPEALFRRAKTGLQDGKTVDERYRNLKDTIVPHSKYGRILAGKHVCLIDDVMTSGATYAAASEACRKAGAHKISVLALARVEKAA